MNETTEIQQLEAFVASYRDKKRERNFIIDELNKTISREKEIKNKLITVEQLVKGRDAIKQRIEKMRSEINISPNDLNSLKLQLQAKHVDDFMPTQKSPGIKSEYLKFNHIDKQSNGLQAKSILILPISQVFLTLALYFLSSENKAILVGVVSLALYFIFFALINLLKNNSIQEIKYEIMEDLKFQKEENLEESKSSIFIKKAWLGAIEKEYFEVEKTITTFLNGEKYDDLVAESSTISQKILNLKNQLETFQIPSSDEYLEKRRRLDLLKLSDQPNQ